MFETLTHRDGILSSAPSWLRGNWLGRLMWTVGLQLDGYGEQLRYAVWSHFPGYYTTEDRVLASLGADRGIPRGWGESAEGYAERLIGWRDAHRRAGSPVALLKQLHALLTQYRLDGINIKVISNAGHTHTIDTDGTVQQYAAAWNWDGDSASWTRFWVVIYAPGLCTDEGTWADTSSAKTGEGFWGDLPHTLGTSLTTDQIETVRSVISRWNAAHAVCQNIIIAYSLDTYQGLAPAGNYVRWSNRDPYCAYIDGTA